MLPSILIPRRQILNPMFDLIGHDRGQGLGQDPGPGLSLGPGLDQAPILQGAGRGHHRDPQQATFLTRKL